MITKREFFTWLETTRPPRRIVIREALDGQRRWAVGCHLPDRRSREGRPLILGRVLCGARDGDSADIHAGRYLQWLTEFELAKENT